MDWPSSGSWAGIRSLHHHRIGVTAGFALISLSFLLSLPGVAAIDVSVKVTNQQCDDPGDVCPAPQALFFDATATTCTAGECSDSWRELQYTWSFDDPAAGTWKTGARKGSRNQDYGPISFHVYEVSGTYDAQLTVSDGTSTVTHVMTIYIDDPNDHFSQSTTCIRRNTSDWAGCPTGSQLITDASSPFQALVNNALASGSRRILFQDGGTYVATGSIYASVPGPVQIATFGPGGIGGESRVTVQMPATTNVLGGPFSAAVERWTVWNFDFVWPRVAAYSQSLIQGNGVNFSTCWNDFLSYQNSAKNTVQFNNASACDHKVNPAGVPHDVFFVNNGQLIDGIGVDNWLCNFYSNQRGVMAGIEFGPNCERDARIEGPHDYGITGPTILSHITFPSSRFRLEANLDIRGGHMSTPNAVGHRYILISDNLFNTGSWSNITISGCCVSGKPARIADMLIENNRALAAIGYGFIRNNAGRRVTVRNNIVEAAGAGILYKNAVTDYSSDMVDHQWPGDNQVINNSIYSSVDMSPVIWNATYDPNFVCRNNIYYSAAGSRSATCAGAGAISNNASRNSADVQIGVNPFAGEVPDVVGPISDWMLNASVDGGLRVIDGALSLKAVQADFMSNERPDGGGADIGALEMQAGPAGVPPRPPVLLD